MLRECNDKYFNFMNFMKKLLNAAVVIYDKITFHAFNLMLTNNSNNHYQPIIIMSPQLIVFTHNVRKMLHINFKYVFNDQMQFSNKTYDSRDTADSLENIDNDQDELVEDEQLQTSSDSHGMIENTQGGNS